MKSPVEDVDEILVSAARLTENVQRLARELEATYRIHKEIVVLVLLQGAKPFARDLLTALDDPRYIYTPLTVRSYFGGTESTGRIDIIGAEALTFSQRDVLIVDDIYDTGRTLDRVKAMVSLAGAASVKTCVLFEKDCRHEKTVTLDFVGMSIPDRFIVGYGLDFQERYRELPYVGVLKEIATT